MSTPDLAALDETLRHAIAQLRAAPARAEGPWLGRAVVLVLSAREQAREIEDEERMSCTPADHGGDDD